MRSNKRCRGGNAAPYRCLLPASAAAIASHIHLSGDTAPDGHRTDPKAAGVQMSNFGTGAASCLLASGVNFCCFASSERQRGWVPVQRTAASWRIAAWTSETIIHGHDDGLRWLGACGSRCAAAHHRATGQALAMTVTMTEQGCPPGFSLISGVTGRCFRFYDESKVRRLARSGTTRRLLRWASLAVGAPRPNYYRRKPLMRCRRRPESEAAMVTHGRLTWYRHHGQA